MLSIRGLYASYSLGDVLHGIDLEVSEGSVASVLGPNGAGKSTLLNSIAGLVPQVRGAIQVDGRSITRLRADRRVRSGIALVPEGRRLFPDLTVRQNLLVGADVRRDRGSAADVDEFLEKWPVVGQRSDQPARNLSGGEQQIVALGRAVMSKPRLLLLDEPSLGLAPGLARNVYDVIADTAQTSGVTIVLVEQNTQLALRFSDTVNVLVAGRIVERGEAAGADPEAIAKRFFDAAAPRDREV